MQDIIIRPYSALLAAEWDAFVDVSRNGTFLHKRGYMEYHADRFKDQSLLVYDNEKAELMALLPASEGKDKTVVSHGGLTYGGIILPQNKVDGALLISIFTEILSYYREKGYKQLVYKAIPTLYHRLPAEEDIYAIFRLRGQLSECNLSSAILLECNPGFNKNNIRNTKKAIAQDVSCRETDDLEQYWQLLQEVLKVRHDATPVHTLKEMTLLKARFPDNIKLFAAFNRESKMIAGTLVYITNTCVHTQYIASSAEGRATCALPLLFDTLINKYTGQKRWFDFGTSNEDHGELLNASLLHQKFTLGGRGIAYQTYTLSI